MNKISPTNWTSVEKLNGIGPAKTAEFNKNLIDYFRHYSV